MRRPRGAIGRCRRERFPVTEARFTQQGSSGNNPVISERAMMAARARPRRITQHESGSDLGAGSRRRRISRSTASRPSPGMNCMT